MFDEEELREMTVAKYDEVGSPHQYLYAGRFGLDEKEYAVFYPLEEELGGPVILRIEENRLVDISDPKEEEEILEALEDWEGEQQFQGHEELFN